MNTLNKNFIDTSFKEKKLTDIMLDETYPCNIFNAFKDGQSEAEYCFAMGISLRQHHMFLKNEEYRKYIEHAKTYAQAWWDSAARKDVQQSTEGVRSTLNVSLWQSIMRDRYGLRDREVHELVDSSQQDKIFKIEFVKPS